MNVYKGDDQEQWLQLQFLSRVQQLEEDKVLWAIPPTAEDHLRSLRPPTVCLYEVDETGIWFNAWLEKSMSGAFLGIWIAPWMRQSKASYHAMLKTMAAALRGFPVVLGITKQERLLASHQRIGYDILTKIPCIYGGADAWLMIINRERAEKRIRDAGLSDYLDCDIVLPGDK